MKLEDRWLQKTDSLFQRLPPIVQILFVLFALIGLVVSWIPELQIGLPWWLRALLFGPIVLMILLEGIPFLVIRWGRAISWPFRKVASLVKKAN